MHHCPNHHVTILAMMHGSTDHQLAEQVQHNAEEQLSFLRAHLGDADDSPGLRFQRGKVPLHQILDPFRVQIREPLPAVLFPRPALKIIDLHQSSNTIEAGCFAFGDYALMHARGEATRLTPSFVGLAFLYKERGIFSTLLGWK